jgi:outer membrane protein assembly factor BamD (BamD/ComL family)
MKFAVVIVLAFSMAAAIARAQSGAVRGRAEALRDEQKEILAKHNLEVARYYFERRKAYEGARDRLQEIIDTYPEFSRMDEVLYLMGEIHIRLGKREEAARYYKKLLEEYPKSERAKRARARLSELGKES